MTTDRNLLQDSDFASHFHARSESAWRSAVLGKRFPLFTHRFHVESIFPFTMIASVMDTVNLF
jgi:hypothetical protein